MLRRLAFGSGLIFLTFLGLSCDGIRVDDGCHDARTGEELKEVRDANGELFPVAKVSFDLGNLIIEYCGVSIDAQVVERDFSVEVLYHPYTGEQIEVEEPRRGVRRFAGHSEYAWY